MQRYAAIFRKGDLLLEGQEKLHALWQVMQNDLLVADKSLLWNNELLEALEVEQIM